MKSAKNDKSNLKRERLQARKRSRLARLIVALCITGAFSYDEAYSQAPGVWKSAAYVSNAPSNSIARGTANSGAVASADPQGALSARPYTNAQGGTGQGSKRTPRSSGRVYSVPTTIPKATSNVGRSTAYASSGAATSQTNVEGRVDVGARLAARSEETPTNVVQAPPEQLKEAAATLQGSNKKLETLEAATQIALEQSRTQRALALTKGAARSTTDAARSLANPKISNATSYTVLANRPTLETNVSLAGAFSGAESTVPGLSEALAGFPMQFQTESLLADKEFVTSVTALTIPVYLGGRVRALTRAAEATTAAIEAGEDVGEQTVKAQVSEAYFLVLRTRKLHEVALEAIQTTQAHLDDAERMLNVGIVTRNVVLAAQVANAEAKQLELRVANAQNLAEAAYNRILWRTLDSKVEIADVELGAPVGELDALTSQAVRSRAELRALQNESRAMQEQENVARADVLPQVAVVGAYVYHQNEALKDNSNGTAAVGMVWTPFDGGTSRARQDAARQSAMAITRAREEAESGIRLQVRQAWLAEQEARERVEVARVAVEQAEENFRVVTRGFQEGLVNHTEALDASTMRTTAKSNFANAQYDAILASQRLKRAVGIL